MSYFFNVAVRVEHLEHVAYYEGHQPGLGARYLAAFDMAMVRVCEAPHRHRVEFHQAVAERAVAEQGPDFGLRAAQLGTESKSPALWPELESANVASFGHTFLVINSAVCKR